MRARNAFRVYLLALLIAVSAQGGEAPASLALAAGQQWTYRIGGAESIEPLTIVGTGRNAKVGESFEVQLISLPLADGATMPVTFRISRAALERSVVKLVHTTARASESGGPPAWDADTWLFDVSVDDALHRVQSSLERNSSCEFDREKMLALDQQAFDQDMNGGWRKLDVNPHCRLTAANLLRDYRAHHRNEAPSLIWHEGQLRADLGDTAAAIALFERSRKPPADRSGWNEYVDATIAFLRGDRAAFDAARAALAALPRPADLDLHDPSGKPVSWPLNLEVVDGLGRCFGMTYKESYGGNCRK